MSIKINIIPERYKLVVMNKDYLTYRLVEIVTNITVAKAILIKIPSGKDEVRDYLYDYVDLKDWDKNIIPKINRGSVVMLENLHVNFFYRKKGFGTMLLQAIIKEEKNIILQANSPDNEIPQNKLIAFYENNGFEILQNIGDGDNLMLLSVRD